MLAPKTLPPIPLLLIIASSGLVGLIIVIAGLVGSLKLALMAPVGIVGALLIILFPYLGILAIVMFTQLDALSNIVFQHLPISGIKLLTILTTIGVLANSWKEPRSQRFLVDSKIMKYAALFTLVILASTMFAENMAYALETLKRYLSLILMLYLILYVVRTEQQLKWILITICAATLLSSLVVLVDWLFGIRLLSSNMAATTAEWGGVSRSAGASDYNPTTSAIMALTGASMALILALRIPSLRWFLLPTVATASVAIVLSFTRSAAIAYAVAVCWLLYKYRADRRLPLLLITLLVGLACATPFFPDQYWDRLLTLFDFDSDSTLWQRLSFNIVGLDLIWQNPILGVGPGNFQEHYMNPEYRWMPGRGYIPRQLHNMYLQVFSETGILGISCFVGIIIVAIKSANRGINNGYNADSKAYAEAILFAYGIYLFAAIVMPHEHHKYTWILPALAVISGRFAVTPNNDTRS